MQRLLDEPKSATCCRDTKLPTGRGLLGRNSWRGSRRSFRLSARTAGAASRSEETAGRSRLTSNRRFASGRRPGWLRPREVSPSRILANRSSRLPSLPLVARPPTGTRSARMRKIAIAAGCVAFRETASGRPGRSPRGSRVAHQPGNRRGSAIGRAIPLGTAKVSYRESCRKLCREFVASSGCGCWPHQIRQAIGRPLCQQ